MEDELTLFAPHVDAVDGDGVEAGIDPQGAVAALDHGQRAHEGVLDAVQAEHTLGRAGAASESARR